MKTSLLSRIMALRFGKPAEDHSKRLIELSTTMEVSPSVCDVHEILEQFLTRHRLLT